MNDTIAGASPVDQPVRPRAWWVAPEDGPSDGAVWTCEPTAEDLAFLLKQTGRAAVVTELGDVAAERERCAKLCEPRPPLVNSDREWILLTDLAERIRSGA